MFWKIKTNKNKRKKVIYIAIKEKTASIWEDEIFSPFILVVLTALGCIIFVMFEKPIFSKVRTLHAFIPPPTEPEHAPIKAIINIKKGIIFPRLERGSRVYPVVVTIETVWKTPNLKESFIENPSLSSKVKVETTTETTTTNKKNLNSSLFKWYLMDLFVRARKCKPKFVAEINIKATAISSIWKLSKYPIFSL